MSENVRYFRLGIFVLAGLALTVGAVLVLGGRDWFVKGIPVETYLNESVQGLDVGAPVKYRGVQVGKVTSIGFVVRHYELTPAEQQKYAGYVMIEIELYPDAVPALEAGDRKHVLAARVNAGLRLRLSSLSLTGPAYLEADYLTPSQYPPMAITWEPVHLYVPSAPSTSSQVMSAVDRIATQLDRVHIDTLLSDLNKLVTDMDKALAAANVPEVSKQVTSLASELRTTNQQLQKILGNPEINKMIDQASGMATSMRQSADQLNKILSDPKINQIMTGMAAAADNAGPATAEFKKTAVGLQRTLAGTSRDLELIIRSLRNVATNLQEVSQEAKDNPSRLLFGNPPPKRKPGE